MYRQRKARLRLGLSQQLVMLLSGILVVFRWSVWQTYIINALY